jgi:hypothetical protein
MLHLSLVGNIMLATGGNFKVYDWKYIPQYPTPMLGHEPELMLRLRRLSGSQLDDFIEVRIALGTITDCTLILADSSSWKRHRLPMLPRNLTDITRWGSSIKQSRRVSF